MGGLDTVNVLTFPGSAPPAKPVSLSLCPLPSPPPPRECLCLVPSSYFDLSQASCPALTHMIGDKDPACVSLQFPNIHIQLSEAGTSVKDLKTIFRKPVCFLFGPSRAKTSHRDLGVSLEMLMFEKTARKEGRPELPVSRQG